MLPMGGEIRGRASRSESGDDAAVRREGGAVARPLDGVAGRCVPASARVGEYAHGPAGDLLDVVTPAADRLVELLRRQHGQKVVMGRVAAELEAARGERLQLLARETVELRVVADAVA